MAGKAYANRKPMAERNPQDEYPTPSSLISCASRLFSSFLFSSIPILDPCCGTSHVFRRELGKLGYTVVENDINQGPGGSGDGRDYLSDRALWAYEQVAMNPPFTQWDDFVRTAKSHARTVIALGRLNYLSTQSRLESGIWDGLAAVAPFSRYVDYRTPFREDGAFHVGAMATGWFVWLKGYAEAPKVQFIDVQKYATLGSYTEPPAHRRNANQNNAPDLFSSIEENNQP